MSKFDFVVIGGAAKNLPTWMFTNESWFKLSVSLQPECVAFTVEVWYSDTFCHPHDI